MRFHNKIIFPGVKQNSSSFWWLYFSSTPKIICPVKYYEKWKQIKWNGNEIWFLLIPLILLSVCVCVCFIVDITVVPIPSWNYAMIVHFVFLSLGVDFIWFSLPYSRSAVCAQLNGKNERAREGVRSAI